MSTNGKTTDRPQASQQQTTSSSGFNHTDALDQLADQAGAAMAGAKQAEMPYVAEAIARQEQAFQSDTDAIAETLAVYLDPRAKLLAGYLKAANLVKDKPDFFPIPKGGYKGILPELPAVPDFSSYYSQDSRSPQPALPSSSSNSSANSESSSDS